MAFSGAMVSKNSDQTATNFSSTVLTWGAEVYDVGGWFDSGTSTSRMTVPSGVSYVRLTVGTTFTSLTNFINGYVWVTKNGDTDGATRHINMPITLQYGNGGDYNICLSSGPLAVSAGDYFEVVASMSGDASSTMEDYSWFAIEALPSFSGCMVKNSADLTTQDYSSATVLTWDTDVIDVGGWHDTGSNTSRLTVPSGVNYVRLTANVNITALLGGADTYCWFIKNGDNNAATRHINLPVTLEDSDQTVRHLNIVSGPLSVTAGDYFELVASIPGDSSVTLEDYSWMSIQKLG